MAPQTTLIAPSSTAHSTTFETPVPTNGILKPHVPVTLFVFLGLCLAYTFSYVLYRFVMAHRRMSKKDMPDTPDRGVSQFMNGARLTIDFSHIDRSATSVVSEPTHIADEGKSLTDTSSPSLSYSSQSSLPDFSRPSLPDSSRPSLPEIPTTGSVGSSSPFMLMMSSFIFHSSQEIGEVQLNEHGSSEAQASVPISPTSSSTLLPGVISQPSPLSQDRVEAIALDPKLAPVQGPLRPLSMVSNASPKKCKTILFGLGLKAAAQDPITDLDSDSARR